MISDKRLKGILTILEKLDKANHSAEVVGGAVRDMILDIIPKDYDIATSATPDKVKELFKEYNLLTIGEKYGTITVIIDDEEYEITTYRSDGNYNDSRHPDTVSYSKCIEDDLSRRDFTMNAMAIKIDLTLLSSNGKSFAKLIDPYNGIDDIFNKQLESVGDAEERFKEDPLRILRAIRFAYKYDLKISYEIYSAIMNLSQLVTTLSKERIHKELIEIIKYYKHNDDDLNTIFHCVLYELHHMFKEMYIYNQFNPYHDKYLLYHTLFAIDNAPEDYIIRMALLLHDCGKLNTQTFDSSGVAHYYNHAKESVKIADEFLTDYKFTNKEKKDILLLIEKHDIMLPKTDKGIKRLIRNIGYENLDKLLIIQECDIKAQSPEYAESRLNNIQSIRLKIEELKNQGIPSTIKELAIDGNDVMSKMNITQCKEVGNILNLLFEYITIFPEFNTREHLLKIIEDGDELEKIKKKVKEDM